LITNKRRSESDTSSTESDEESSKTLNQQVTDFVGHDGEEGGFTGREEGFSGKGNSNVSLFTKEFEESFPTGKAA